MSYKCFNKIKSAILRVNQKDSAIHTFSCLPEYPPMYSVNNVLQYIKNKHLKTAFKCGICIRSKAELRRSFSAYACSCVFKVIFSDQGNYFENATACIKRTLKTTVATQLKRQLISKSVIRS